MKFLPSLLVAAFLVAGCSQSRQATTGATAPKPILLDEYSVLDDAGRGAPLSDQKLRERLEQARVAYLRALRLVERGDQKKASLYFEASISILNELMNHPDIERLAEYTRLSQSVIQDYESRIGSTDELDPNSSFFVLRDKMFQEIEMLPVAAGRRSSAETGPARPDTLQIALPENEAVQQTIAYFTSEKGHRFFSKWLARSGKYFPMYERILAEEGAPDELKYLSMIESGLNTNAVSWAKAVGLWQFIPSTGRMYGMKIDWYRDERRDPEKATRAAARYLTDLYKEMGDWHLALASYNCGPGRMRRAIRKADSSDYWVARQYLPRETRQYVPLYIAAAKIARDPEAYGFTGIVPHEPDNYDVVSIKGPHTFRTISDAGSIDMEELRRLNPELLQDQVPPGQPEYFLRVPRGQGQRLAVALDNLPEPEGSEVSWIRHKVQSGETVTRIAARYGVPVTDVLEANEMTARSTLYRGSTLKIPVYGGVDSDDEDSQDVASAEVEEVEEPSAAAVETDDDSNAMQASSTTRAETRMAPTTSDTKRDTQIRVSPSEEVAETSSTEKKTAEVAVVPSMTTSSRYVAGEPTNFDEILSEPTTSERKDRVASRKEIADAAATEEIVIPSSSEAVASSAGNSESTAVMKVSNTPTAPKGSAVTHVVKRGETLSGIAERYGVSPSQIKSWNSSGINHRDEVILGARLKIHASATPSASKPTASTPRKYRVRRGETLTSISEKFNVSMRELQNNNPRINPNRLQAGQVIRLR